MTPLRDPRRTWRRGYTLLMIAPFIGLVLVFADPPRWLEIVCVIAIVALVATGSSMMRRQGGGWRPSETVTESPGDDR